MPLLPADPDISKGKMTAEEIAKRLCECSYAKLSEEGEKQAPPSFEEFWEGNRHYFLRQAETYIEVKRLLEAE